MSKLKDKEVIYDFFENYGYLLIVGVGAYIITKVMKTGWDIAEKNLITIILIILGGILIWLMTKRWFWNFIFFLGFFASLFSMIASIIHFQIGLALIFLILTIITYGIWMVILEK